MWDRIVEVVSAEDLSFRAMVGNNSRVTSFENGEIVITVKKNKLALAESSRAKIDRVAKKLYGENVFCTLRGGKLTDRQTDRAKVSEQPGEGIADADAEAVARDVSEMLGGLKVDIIE